jgi:Tol biopolymer transport system component/DNA-binding winged helix-turn-helix (wHTH) protein
MEQPECSKVLVRFGAFEVDLASGELRKQGTRLRLQEQPFKVLAALLDRPGQLVPREELVRQLWPDGTFVDFDRGLNAAVTRLRQALNDSADTPRYVETVARRGYRFLAPVEEVDRSSPAPLALGPGRAAQRNWWIWSCAAVLALIAAVSILLLRTPGETKLEQITRDPGLATDPSLSPDGKLLAYASDRDGQNLNIWLKQLAGDGHAVQLTHDTTDAHQPSFSPDGGRIVYRSEGGGLYVIPAIGGEPVLLATNGLNPRFSPDGKWIAFWSGGRKGSRALDADPLGAIFVIPAAGGEPKRVGASLPPGGYPVWSPDSRQLLVYAGARTGATTDPDWWVASLEGDAVRKTGAFASFRSAGFSLDLGSALARVSSWVDDTVTFSAQKGDSRGIWRVRLKAGNGTVLGQPERLTLGTSQDIDPSSISRNSLVFASLSQGMAIWSLPIEANEGKVTGELQRITSGAMLEGTPSLSADGRMMAYGSTVTNHEDIWLKDLQTSKETAVAKAPAAEWHPLISRDGSMIAYTALDPNLHGIFTVPASGGKSKQVAPVSAWIFEWTPDNQHLLLHLKSGDPILKSIDLRSGVMSDYLSAPGASLFQSKFSPDFQWLVLEAVFSSPAEGGADSRLFVVKIENGSPAPRRDWILVSDEHGWADKPRWSPDGNMLYFISDRDGFLCIWAQRLDPKTKHQVSSPFPVYHFHRSRYSATNVGSGLLEMDVAGDKVVMNLGELTGNIWNLSHQ